MNIVAELNDHGVSMIHQGKFLEGFRAIRAALKILFYVNQANGLIEDVITHIEADQQIQEVRTQMEDSIPTVQSQPRPLPHCSFLYDRLFSFSDLQNLQPKMMPLLLIYNMAIAAHRERTMFDAASACYAQAYQIASNINETSSTNEMSQLIGMLCLNNLADIERELGDYAKVKAFLTKMDSNATSVDKIKSSAAVYVRSNLQLNALVFKDLSTAGAA